MRKVPVFLLAISLAALLAGCAGQMAWVAQHSSALCQPPP